MPTNYFDTANSRMKKLIAKGFHGRVLTGTIRRKITDSMNDYGDPEASSANTYKFEGVRDTFDAKYRAQALIPEQDVVILVLLGSTKAGYSLPGPDSSGIGQDDQILIAGQWHQVRNVLEVDTAGAHARLQAFVIPDPTVTP